MPESKMTPEQFRESLQEIVAILPRLAPFVRSVGDLNEILVPALESDAQLHLLMKLVLGTK